MKTKFTLPAVFYVLLLILTIPFIQVSAQEQKWKELILSNPSVYQAKGLDVHLFKETYVGLEGQQFTVKISNLTVNKIKVQGSLNAVTWCGNTVTVKIEVTINPGKTLGGSDYLFDQDGLSGTVQPEDCRTDKIYPDPNDKTVYKYDRIRSVGLGSISITPIAEDNANAQKPATATGNNSTTGNTNSSVTPAWQYSTTQPNTTTTGNTSAQQQQYQQQANNYLNQASTSNNDIQNALNLNLAKINAQASGNTAQVNQINQIQRQQTQQQIQQLGDMATSLLLGSMDRKIQKQNEFYEKSRQKDELERENQKVLDQNKVPLIDRLKELIRQDRDQLSGGKDALTIIQYLNNINTRSQKILEVTNAKVEVSWQMEVSFTKVDLNNANNDMINIAEQEIKPYSLVGYPSSQFKLMNKDKSHYYAGGDITVNYSNAMTYLNGDRSEKINRDTAKGVQFLQAVEKSDPKDAKSQYRYTADFRSKYMIYYVPFHWEYKKDNSLGFAPLGLTQMTASSLLGDIYYDSARKAHQTDYLKKAWHQYAKSLDYYFDNLHGYVDTIYKEGNIAAATRYNYPSGLILYPQFVKSVYAKFLVLSYQLLTANDSNEEFADSCMLYCAYAYTKLYAKNYGAIDFSNREKVTPYDKAWKYYQERDYTNAMKYFQQAAENGNAAGYLLMGTMYYDGNGVKPDTAKTIVYWQKAADAGDPSAYSSLGYLYEKGRGVQPDLPRALELFTKAKSLGSGTADNNIKRVQLKMAARGRKNTANPLPVPGLPNAMSNPVYPGGDAALGNYLGDNLGIFLQVNSNLLQGRILVSFVIEIDGTCTVEKVDYINNQLQPYEQDIRDLFETMPLWQPAIMNGQKVKMKMTLPINLR